jgi:NADPH-dependent curcumin reductase
MSMAATTITDPAAAPAAVRVPPLFLNKKWVLARRPTGLFSLDDVTLVADPILADEACVIVSDKSPGPMLSPTQILVKVQMLSVDAFIRTMLDEEAYHGSIAIGDVIPAIGYGTVVAVGSAVKSQRVGSVVSGLLGAQNYAKLESKEAFPNLVAALMPRVASLSLGLLSLTTGLTAYVGTFYVAKPPGRKDTVVVSAASGAVGSVACQLAKRVCMANRVIGIAGGPVKCAYLMKELKLDGCIDYKHPSKTVSEPLAEVCPDGIDFLYDNVGGAVLDACLERINPKGRVVICGAISQYSGKLNKGGVEGPSSYLKLAERGAIMAGFNVMQHMMSVPRATLWMLWYYWRGSVSLKEHIEPNIEAFPLALQKLFTGGHTGKMLVNAEGDPSSAE